MTTERLIQHLQEADPGELLILTLLLLGAILLVLTVRELIWRS